MELQSFSNPVFGQIRTLTDENGDVWFIGKDVATSLGYRNLRSALIQHVDAQDKGSRVLETPGGNQQVTVINESGLYSLVFTSKMPQAKAFKRWVTSEVLPQIRQTGGYIPVSEEDDETTLINKASLIVKLTLAKHEMIKP